MSAHDASNPTANPTNVRKPEPSNQPTGDAAAHYVERQLAPVEDVASYLKRQETPHMSMPPDCAGVNEQQLHNFARRCPSPFRSEPTGGQDVARLADQYNHC